MRSQMEQNISVRDAITKPAKLHQFNDAIIFFSVPSIYYEIVRCSTLVCVFRKTSIGAQTIKLDKSCCLQFVSFEHSTDVLHIECRSELLQTASYFKPTTHRTNIRNTLITPDDRIVYRSSLIKSRFGQIRTSFINSEFPWKR